ncbi:acyltransferase family protein [Herbaspirillum lusitanum]|uniref:Acyltransferase family protein n=1 Tax=Herbaspirillum lusitanum TaxID=213312 RepID=A0ABW9A8Z2_9BURK
MQREQWIDVYRGIGIIMVVWGHVYGGYSFDLIFLFHMPLFFFISGYLFRPPPDYRDFIRRKAIQLLIPYAAFLLLFMIPQATNLLLHLPQDSRAIIRFFKAFLLGGRALPTAETAFWFTTCFFTVLLMEAFLIRRCSRRVLLWLHAGMLALSYLNNFVFPEFWLIGNANVALAAAPFFYAGYLFHAALQSDFEVRRIYLWATGAALFFMAVVIANHHFDGGLYLPYDMKVSHYGTPVLSFIAALACCISLLWIARRISASYPRLSQALAGLGQAAIVILFLHQALSMAAAWLFGEDQFFIRFTVALLGSYWLYRQCRRWRWTRAFLLGSEKDFRGDPGTATALQR